MKRVKFLLVFVFLLVGTLTVLAFTSDKYHKHALAIQCLRYTGPQIVFPPYTELLQAGYWSTQLGNPSPNPCNIGEDICAICFDNTQLTANEARQILWEYYRDHGFWPASGTPIIISGKVVWVYTKTIE